MIECTASVSRDEKIRQTDSVSVVLFMWSTGSVLLAAYARWKVSCLHNPR